jgi:hypothetical protein|tara:strand:+ start:848 stop:1087 length:240 start_codon:yes stop_codon:yes gene_type:complete
MQRARNGNRTNIPNDPAHTNASLPQCFGRRNVNVNHGTTAKSYGVQQDGIGKANGRNFLNGINFSPLNGLVYVLAKTFE